MKQYKIGSDAVRSKPPKMRYRMAYIDEHGKRKEEIPSSWDDEFQREMMKRATSIFNDWKKSADDAFSRGIIKNTRRNINNMSKILSTDPALWSRKRAEIHGYENSAFDQVMKNSGLFNVTGNGYSQSIYGISGSNRYEHVVNNNHNISISFDFNSLAGERRIMNDDDDTDDLVRTEFKNRIHYEPKVSNQG